MEFWNFSHNTLGMHVYMLPSIVVGISMLVSGLIHGRNMKKREQEFEEQLGATSSGPAAEE